MKNEPADLTVLSRRAGEDDIAARSNVFEAAQIQVHQMAERRLAQEYLRATIQAMMPVRDAYLLSFGGKQSLGMNDRRPSYVLTAGAMRLARVDRACNRVSFKRSDSDQSRSSFDITDQVDRDHDERIPKLLNALCRLEESNSRHSEIIELRHLGVYCVEEFTESSRVSASTVGQVSALARALPASRIGQ